jgi:ABC-type branched-subunit amino acid transport system ATPase component
VDKAKRVNIGLALITRPPVLFLDEPTSGKKKSTIVSAKCLSLRY